MIELPGASSDVHDAMFEYEATASCLVVAPTLIAVEMQPGSLMPFTELLLPAEITVAMPTPRRLSIAGLTEEVSHGAVFSPPPRLRFAEAMFQTARREYTYPGRP